MKNRSDAAEYDTQSAIFTLKTLGYATTKHVKKGKTNELDIFDSSGLIRNWMACRA
jgi:hypothetical protein